MVRSQPPGSNGGTATDDEAPLGPADSLALIERETDHARRSLGASPAPFLICWGTTCLLIFAAFYLAVPGGPEVLPLTAAMITLGVLIVGSIAFSAAYGIRSGRGLRGGSRVVGAMYGLSWPAAFLVLGVVNSRFTDEFGLTAEQNSLLWSSTSMLLIGAMYMVGGALWRATTMYVFGVVALLSSACAVLVGVPGNLLVLGVALGGGMLALGGYLMVSSRGAWHE